MQNYKIILEYDGTNYHGWQVQPNGRTIQGELTRVLSLLEGREVTVHGAGRTDAGVHAVGQVANFFLERQFQAEKLRDAINGNLERDIRVLKVELVSDEFHSRFSAKEKTYRYVIWTGAVMSAFEYRYAYHHRDRLNVEAMREATSCLIGQHDFSAFTVAASEVESHVRELRRLDIEVESEAPGERLLIYATAEGFLRYMVRNLVGTLIDIGRGNRAASDMPEILASRDRARAGQTAKPHGLTLLKVGY
ncbi:MAG: tRNA pseudouridine(38-40) synthase TruA [Acidobacteriota bacterium]